jgi:hypothetical protein
MYHLATLFCFAAQIHCVATCQPFCARHWKAIVKHQNIATIIKLFSAQQMYIRMWPNWANFRLLGDY